MGFYFKVNELKQDLKMAYQLAKGKNDLVKKLYQIAEACKPYKQEVRKDIQEKLSDLKQLIVYDSLDKSMRLTLIGAQKRDELLEKHKAKNAPEAIAGIAGEINERYNMLNTDEAKYVDLKVLILEYSAKNYQELVELKKLENKAEHLQADYVVQKVKDAYEKLVAEENELCEMVKNSKPENYKASGHEDLFVEDYNLLVRVIKNKTSLYREQGRTDLLWAYHQHVKDCGGDPERVEKGILAANEYWGRGETLEKKTQSAQKFRKESGAKTPEISKENRSEPGIGNK
ncbi:MAG: hypothetical protein PHS83_02975 [Clostridia bacterium]|nr:hypothetical protein [Clostridia bacterium]